MEHTLTPFAGIAPGAPLRLGAQRTGKTHAAPGDVTTDPQGVTTMCGRTVRAVVIFYPEDWPDMVADHNRLSRTHQVNTCAECVRLTPPAPVPAESIARVVRELMTP